MLIRKFKEDDREMVEKIFSLHWTDPEFLKELSEALQPPTNSNQDCDSTFYVAEEDNEILGVVAYRKLPDYLKPFSKEERSVELYVIAVKNKRKGVGRKLKQRFMDEVKKLSYNEILLFSPNSHSDSWKFHDLFDFERVGEVTPPEDDIGQVWRKIL